MKRSPPSCVTGEGDGGGDKHGDDAADDEEDEVAGPWRGQERPSISATSGLDGPLEQGEEDEWVGVSDCASLPCVELGHLIGRTKLLDGRRADEACGVDAER